MSQIISSVFPDCTTEPFTRVSMCLPWKSSASSGMPAASATSAIGRRRLARAMAATRIDRDEGPDFAEALANRDALLALT